jgi:hypothetical protein
VIARLSGRDDEFVTVVTLSFTGMRWGELVRLEARYLRPAGVRVEWHLYELDNGQFHRCPPKDESRRTVAAPAWLLGMLTDQVSRRPLDPCPCHGHRYVFGGHRTVNGSAGQTGPRLVDVARRAGVGTGTVSAVLNDRPIVAEPTRAKVHAAMDELGYVRGAPGSQDLLPDFSRAAPETRIGFRPGGTKPVLTC